MFIWGLNNIYGNRAHENSFGVKALGNSEKEDISLTEKAAEGSPVRKEDSVEISPEGRLAAEQKKEVQKLAGSDMAAQNDEEAQESAGSDAAEQNEEEVSGKVAVNEGKRARQIAAAQNQEQVRQVLALLKEDLAECKAGLEKGWCDESEIAKVEALLNKANARLSQVPQKKDDAQGDIDAFAMASLM